MFENTRIFLLKHALDYAAFFRMPKTVDFLLGLRFTKNLTGQERAKLARPAINTACQYGRSESIKSLLNYTKENLTNSEKTPLALDAIKSISRKKMSTSENFDDTLPTALASLPFTLVATGVSLVFMPPITYIFASLAMSSVAVIAGSGSAAYLNNEKTVNGGQKQCFEQLLSYSKDLTPEQKVEIAKESIKIAISQDNHEAFKSSLDLLKNISDQDKINLLNNKLDSSTVSKKYKSDILNFFADSKISVVYGKNLWEYAQENNLEPQAHKLWELTKDSYENIDAVNNRLLGNKETGLKFFADIANTFSL